MCLRVDWREANPVAQSSICWEDVDFAVVHWFTASSDDKEPLFKLIWILLK